VLTDDQLRTLARASSWWGEFDGESATKPFDERVRDLALEALGRPDDETIITSALAALENDDRNLRVAALRVLRWHLGDDRVAVAMVRVTRDPARRVRRIAVQLCALLIERPGVAERLREIVDDPQETNKIAGTALASLAGSATAGAPGSALRTVSDLLGSDAYRERILLLLLQHPVDDASEQLLREVIKNGTKGEAVSAARAMCGFRMTNLAHVPESDRKRVVASCERADLSWVSGRAYAQAAFYWVPSATEP
jgi:HEAT repeat protein